MSEQKSLIVGNIQFNNNTSGIHVKGLFDCPRRIGEECQICNDVEDRAAIVVRHQPQFGEAVDNNYRYSLVDRIVELEAENTRLKANNDSLREIARLANFYIGGACCEEHYQQTRKRLIDAMKVWKDDSFTERCDYTHANTVFKTTEAEEAE